MALAATAEPDAPQCGVRMHVAAQYHPPAPEPRAARVV